MRLLSIPRADYFRARSAETMFEPSSSKEKALSGDAIFDIERCDYRRVYGNIGICSSRARSRSKSLSRRRSFSITAVA